MSNPFNFARDSNDILARRSLNQKFEDVVFPQTAKNYGSGAQTVAIPAPMSDIVASRMADHSREALTDRMGEALQDAARRATQTAPVVTPEGLKHF